jgi:UDP-N-acetylmuramate dehydrogenase
MGLVRQADAPLRGLNTFGIDARARVLWRLESLDDLPQLCEALRDDAGKGSAQPPLILGSGSNLLIADDPQQPIVQMALRGLRIVQDDGNTVIVEAAAGEAWDPLVRWTLSQGLAGLENLALIPGTVGAAPIQNIGAYGVELRDHFESLDTVNLEDGTFRSFDATDCAFGYRDSVFKHADAAGRLVTSVRLRLSRVADLKLDYGEIRTELAESHITAPTPTDVADAVSRIRRRKLPDPTVIGNAGSFFKNPLIDAGQATALAAREPGLPCWPSGDQVKVSAAWMIERCGFKGMRVGDAGVHARHALVLVNHGHARGSEILALASRIRDAVATRFGIRLEAEPMVVGAPQL